MRFNSVHHTKHGVILFLIGLFLSCGNERILQLPEIDYATITEIKDVSHAYLFYDEMQPDQVDLNRKNLIITTNWLINVDKRLTLGQAIPKIKFLQEKKRNSELHKNEAAKNYYTCSAKSIQNLGFIEFTEVVYQEEFYESYFSKKPNKTDYRDYIYIKFYHNTTAEIIHLSEETSKHKLKLHELSAYLMSFNKRAEEDKTYLNLNFSKDLSFQNFIKIKSILSKLDLVNIYVDNNEFIY